VKVADYWSTHYELTGKSSDVVRTLVLSGAAIVWLFHESVGGRIILPTLTIWSLGLFSIAALFDLLQYAWLGGVYGWIARVAERNGASQDDELPLHEAWRNWPGYFFYWGKIVLAATGYVLLATYLVRSLG
jgi:hypothetical protein